MEAQSQRLFLPKSHSSSYMINSISGERGFIKVCFLGVLRQHSPPKWPWARCSNSPVFEKCPQLSARFPKPSQDRVCSFNETQQCAGASVSLQPIFWTEWEQQTKQVDERTDQNVWKWCSKDAKKDHINGFTAVFITSDLVVGSFGCVRTLNEVWLWCWWRWSFTTVLPLLPPIC